MERYLWTNVNEDKGEERVECDEMVMCNERERSEPQNGVGEYMYRYRCVKEKKIWKNQQLGSQKMK